MGESLNFLNDFWLVQAMKYSLWLYPTVESLHICGIGMLFGRVVLMDLRLLGVCPNIDFRAISRLGISVSMFGFTLAVLNWIDDVYYPCSRSYRLKIVRDQDVFDFFIA